jgi:hypothetical protein
MIEIFINLKNAKSANSCEKIEKIGNIESTISSVKNLLKFSQKLSKKQRQLSGMDQWEYSRKKNSQ